MTLHPSDRPGFRERLAHTVRVGPALALIRKSAPRWTIVSAALVLIEASVPLAALYLTKLVVDTVAAGVADPGTVAFSQVLWLLGAAAGVAVLGTAARSLSAYAAEIQGHLVTDHVLDIIHERSGAADLAFYEDPEYFDTLHRAQREGTTRPTRILSHLLSIGRSAATLMGILVLLATVHWVLALVLAAAVLPAMAVRIRFAERLYQWQVARAGTERHARYMSTLLTAPAAAQEVRTYGLTDHLTERSRDLRDRLREERMAIARTRSVEELLVRIGAAVVVFGSLAFIAYLALGGALTIGDLVMYFGAVQRGQAVLQTLFDGLGGLYEDNLFLKALDDFMTLRPTVRAPESPRPLPRDLVRGFELDDVCFRYPGTSQDALTDIDFSLAPGQMVALVGHNGSGKTTLVKMLCRLYDPNRGTARLEGIDVREFDPVELRRIVAVVYQDFLRFHATAGENIGFGDVSVPADADRIVGAARAAGAASVVEGLPRGIDTPLGNWIEAGSKLSGGEWQKLALARAFYSDARFLILDEPTSSLDAESEAKVFMELRSRASDRGILVISHRFSTVRMADRIDVMESGRIIESGSHGELMARGGRYAELYSLQARAFGPMEEERVAWTPGSGPTDPERGP